MRISVMKKTHTLLNRHQLLDPVALRNWLAHNLDPGPVPISF